MEKFSNSRWNDYRNRNLGSVCAKNVMFLSHTPRLPIFVPTGPTMRGPTFIFSQPTRVHHARPSPSPRGAPRRRRRAGRGAGGRDASARPTYVCGERARPGRCARVGALWWGELEEEGSSARPCSILRRAIHKFLASAATTGGRAVGEGRPRASSTTPASSLSLTPPVPA
jgi:hypothetical protein